MTKGWIAVCVLAAACGKGSKANDKADGVAHLKAEAPIAMGSAAAPAAPDPACSAKVIALAPWLMAFELERSSYEIDFGYKLQKIDRAPRPVEQRIDAVEITANSLEAFDASESNHAESKLGKNPEQKAVADRLVTIHGMANDAPDRLRIDVDEKATWKDVARVVDAAIKAGYKEAVFAFTATSKLAVPPGDEEWTSKAEDVDAAGKKLEAMQKQCEEWGSALLRHRPNPDEAVDAQVWGSEISEAIEKCNCAVNVDDVKAQMFKEARWHQAVPRVGVLVQLADSGTAISSAGKATWADAHKPLVAAAPDGAPPPTIKLVAK